MQYLASNDEAHIFVSCLQNLCVSYDIDAFSVKLLLNMTVQCLPPLGLDVTISWNSDNLSF